MPEEPTEYVIKLKDSKENILYPQAKQNFRGHIIPSFYYGITDPDESLGEEGDIYFKF